MTSLILTWWKTFFVWCTQHDRIDEYRRILSENMFACMEMCRQQYVSIIDMPVKRFYDLLKWKTQLEEDRKKIMDENTKGSKF